MRRVAHDPMRSMKLDVPKAPGQKRYNAGLAYGACGAGWRAGQQLAWLTAKSEPLEWHVEVDFGTEVPLPMLEGHLASGRLTWTPRGHESPGPLSCFWVCVALFGNMQTKLAPGEPGRKKKTEHFASTDERACLGGSAGGW